MENAKKVVEANENYNPELLGEALDNFGFSQSSIWGGYDQDSNLQEQNLSFNSNNLSINQHRLNNGGNYEEETNQYNYSTQNQYHNINNFPQTFVKEPTIFSQQTAQLQDFSGMNINEYQNLLQPIEKGFQDQELPQELPSSQISAPQQLQNNMMVGINSTLPVQDRISPPMSHHLSDQKGNKRK